MLRVGLTGGIGSGKSSVASRLVERGAVLIDADRIAREVVEPGTPGFDAVRAEFGAQVIGVDGALDRPALGRLVFADRTRLETLNAIVHPLVAERRGALLAEAPEAAVVVEDIPLLAENDLGGGFQLVVVVHASADERLRRLVDLRGMDVEDVRARMAAQADDAVRHAVADAWIDNSGALEQTLAAVDDLWDDRLVPFEENVRLERRAPRAQRAVLAEPDPTWPVQARRLIDRLVRVVGPRALRIDHIGSTSVPGLAAKDVLDVQIVTESIDEAARSAGEVVDAGLVRMPDRWWDNARDGSAWDKAMACNADPLRAVNCHVRPVSSPTWRDALLLRDWLRAHPAECAAYAAEKRRLTAIPHASIDAYADSKSPWIGAALTRADGWAQRSGWTP